MWEPLWIALVLAGAGLAPALAAGQGRPVPDAPIRPSLALRSPGMREVKWTDGFWADKFRLCREAMIPGIQQALSNPRNAAVLDNFRIAAGLKKGKHLGTNWGDGDCYKWLEAVARVYAATGDKKLDALLDEWIAVIAKAQAPDGYLSTNIQLTGRPRFANPHHHEMYNMGHLLTAASVHHRATG